MAKQADIDEATGDDTLDDDAAQPRPRWWPIAPVIVALALLAWGAWHYRWMLDDAFIDLRIVRQLQAGHGPVFNRGERVEAATSPAWLAYLFVADVLLPFPIEWIAVISGIVLTLGGVGLACAGAATLTERRPREILVPVGALVLAALPAMWLNASTGLENGLVFAWLGAVFWCLARWSRGLQRPSLTVSVLVGFGPLIRPELTLASVLFAVLVVVGDWRARGVRAVLAFGAAAFALPVVYEIFRMGYYAALAPNPALAKEASKAYWSAGWRYFHQTVDPYWLWVPVALALLGGYVPLMRQLLRHRAHRGAALVATFFVYALCGALFVVRVGGDFVHARLLLPSLFAILAPVAVLPLRRAYAGALLVVPWAIVCAVALRSPGDLPRGPLGDRNQVTLQQFQQVSDFAPNWRLHGNGAYYVFQRLDAAPLPGKNRAAADYAVGVVGYKVGPNVYVLDLLGLGDAEGSRLELQRRSFVAHEKPLPGPWIVARLVQPGGNVSDIFSTSGSLMVPIDSPDGEPFDQRVAEARAALQCGELRDLQQAVRGHLTPGRFISNIAHSVEFWRMRVPPEPRDAVAKFCGSAHPGR